MRTIFLTFFLFAACACISFAESPQVQLILRQRTDGQASLDIFAHNVSTQTVDIISPHLVPHWSVTQWFKWKVNGKEAEINRNVALIPGATVTQRIAPGFEFLWTNIPLQDIEQQTPHGWQSAIAAGGANTIEIFPSPRWGDITVASGTLLIQK